MLAALICLIVYASDKPPVSVERVMQSFMMFNASTRTIYPSGLAASGDDSASALDTAARSLEKCEAAEYVSAMATSTVALVSEELANAAAITVDFGFSYQSREPSAVNQMAQVQWVTATNISGILYEDHYVEFSSTPTEAPGMVFDYSDLLNESHTVEAITNSFPTVYGITLPSGVHSCYWFRCEVPVAFTNRLRTWKGPVRFGGPVGSSYGLSIAGVFLIDDGNTIWQGRTLTTQIGSNTVEWLNGVSVTPLSSMAMAEEVEERGILHTLGTPYRAVRSMFSPTKINLTTNTINKTTWQGTTTYPLAFPIKKESK